MTLIREFCSDFNVLASCQAFSAATLNGARSGSSRYVPDGNSWPHGSDRGEPPQSAEAIDLDDERDRRKVIVFSYYADTVDWIVDFLEEETARDSRLACDQGRIAAAGRRDGREAAPVWVRPPHHQRPARPPGAEVSDQVFSELREEIERVRRQDPSFFEEAGEEKGVLSGEEYRQELRRALENPQLAERLRALAWGSGSGMARAGAEQGYVFCARIADHPQPQYRYVEWPEEGAPAVVAETLDCLAQARPDHGPDTARVLPDQALRAAYEAWDRARRDILERWNAASDPRALAPEVPKAMREAADLIRRTPPPGWTQEQVEGLLDTLEDAYPERIQRQIRAAIRSHDDPVEQAKAIAAKVEELGLEPSPPPEPLPPISEEDIHLICWLAVVAAAPR